MPGLQLWLRSYPYASSFAKASVCGPATHKRAAASKAQGVVLVETRQTCAPTSSTASSGFHPAHVWLHGP